MDQLLVLAPLFVIHIACDNDYSSINLPDEHLPFYFTNLFSVANKCRTDISCPYRKYLNNSMCWGYEQNCTWTKQYSRPSCPGDHRGWVKSKLDQQNTFYTQADFGYVKQQRNEMKVLCAPLYFDDSSLECSEHLRFCRGRNIMINFKSLSERDEPLRYKMDVLSDGEIGGYCDFRPEVVAEEADHISPLQSWGPEIRYFTRLKRRPIIEGDCDVVIEKPTYILKIDATVNMYHHFCDFLNLYASLHLNATTQWDTFSTDVHILIWETYTYYSAFQDTWEAFSDHPIWDLKTFKGKKVCFKNVVFPLLPRMIFGLYYNTPIIYGCEGSGLFNAFSQHILHRLKIPVNERDEKIRITFLSRDTKFRRILNEDALLSAISSIKDFSVQKVVYNRNIPFKRQLEITRNTDIFIGIHGAGLTHILFLPEWAVTFELYNCEDANCYFDLARLKGVKYITWQNASKLRSEVDENYEGAAHAKFANYAFDVDEFKYIVQKAAKHVKNHPMFLAALKNLKGGDHDEL